MIKKISQGHLRKNFSPKSCKPFLVAEIIAAPTFLDFYVQIFGRFFHEIVPPRAPKVPGSISLSLTSFRKLSGNVRLKPRLHAGAETEQIAKSASWGIEMVDIATELQLYGDLEKGDDSKFSKDLTALPWDDRAEYLRDVNARLEGNRASHPELPVLSIESSTYTDLMGTSHEFVSSVKAVEERSWYNPARYLSGHRTSPYEIYSPTWMERLSHGVNKYMKTPPN
jgi:hypothetical protein